MKSRFLLILVLFNACTSVKKSTIESPRSSLEIAGKLFAAAYQQQVVEYRALYYQAYDLAHAKD